MLDRKLLRDLLAWRGQIAAIALIVACGISAYVAMQSVYESLNRTRSDYYERYRFGSLHASLTRAPEHVARQLAAIDGVAAVQTRVVADVTLDLAGRDDALTGRLIAIPETRRPSVNDLFVRSGRYLDPGRSDEALISEAFAAANGLRLGDRVAAVVNRRRQTFRIVGIALSPEYVYEIRSAGDIWPDNRHFGVLWVGRKALAAAFDLTDSFNDVALRLAPGADEAAAIAAVDRVLARYGSLGTLPARQQASNRFLSDELTQLRAQAIFIPLIFLAVAAFLLDVAMARLVATQRQQIAILKALGYGNPAIALHYVKTVAVVMAIGAAGGTLLGAWLGWRLTIIYTAFFRFPVLDYRLTAGVAMAAVGIAGVAALAGALDGVRRAVRLRPAEAMRPPSPPLYRTTLFERVGFLRALPPAARMVVRNVARRPVPAGFNALAVALATAVLIVGRYGLDAVNYAIDLQFRTAQREDVTLSFVRPLSNRARFELAALPGVREVEPFRAVVVRLASGQRARRLVLLGLPQPSPLLHVLDARSRRIEVPASGLMISRKLAQILDVRVGEPLAVSVLERRSLERPLVVTRIVDDVLGLNAYAGETTVHRLLDEDGTVSGAYVTLDPRQRAQFERRTKALPAVAGVSYRVAMMEQFERTVASSMGISIAFLIGFAGAIACGVIYNAGRIAVSERGRELSTLRVLGFTRGETAAMLLGEQAALTLLAIPLGWVLGYALCRLLQPAYETEVYRLPVIVQPSTYLFAAGVVVGAALVSGLILRRQLDRLDVVAVLKAAE